MKNLIKKRAKDLDTSPRRITDGKWAFGKVPHVTLHQGNVN